jgi:hypothetical protein
MIVNPYSDESIPTYFEYRGYQKEDQRMEFLHSSYHPLKPSDFSTNSPRGPQSVNSLPDVMDSAPKCSRNHQP